MAQVPSDSRLDSHTRTAVIDPETEGADVVARLAAEPAVGTLQGRYMVLENVGRGAMGCVLRAYDPKLQREVALKIVSGWTLDPHARERMMREAQAMAQLSHPNVVAVHDTEESDAGVVLVMEYVSGQTLRRWARHGEPSWSEVVAHLVQAGRGLAAAHAVGLLHRDFKPDNVLVAESGTVKVTDFGLAKLPTGPRSEAGESFANLSAEPSSSSGSFEMALTRVGAVVGTPRYMAPEQHRGDDLGPAADQYAFCVSLWEVLVGEAPHRARSLKALIEEKLADPPAWPSDGPAVPRRVVEALRRGLAANPRDRFDGMGELLAALSHDPRRQRNRRVLGVGAVSLAGALGLGGWSWATARAQRCSGASEQLAGVWDEPRRAEVSAAMLAVDASFAEPAWERARTALDRYAEGWVQMHTEACEATTVRGEQSTEMMDLRMACLHRARVGLDAVTTVLAGADVDVARHADDVVGSLSPLGRCADTDGLRAEVEPPGPEQVEGVERIRKLLAEADVESEAARYKRALQRVEMAQRELVDVDYGPVRTEVALSAGDLLDDMGRYEDAERELRVALESASRWHQWDLMQHSAESLMYLVGYEQRRMAEGRQLWGLTLGLAVGDPGAEAGAHNVMANILLAEGRAKEAEVEHRRSLELERMAPGSDEVDVAISRANLAMSLMAQGKYDEAEHELRQALAASDEMYGPDHPTGGLFHNNLANVLSAKGEAADAEKELRRALTLMEQALGSEHPDVALAMGNLAYVLYAQGELTEAEALHRRALAVRLRVLGPEHPDVGQARNHLANVLHAQARYDEAVAELDLAIPLLEAALGPDHVDIAQIRSNLGLIRYAQGDYPAAEKQMRRAMSMWVEALGPDHPSVGLGHNNLALVLYGAERYEQAEQQSRLALEIQQRTLGPEHPHVAVTRNNLAQVLAAQGQLEQAEAEQREVVALTERAQGAEHADSARARHNLGKVLAMQGKSQEAEAEIRGALVLWEATLGPEHPNLATAQHNLARLLLEVGRSTEAQGLAEQAWARRKRDDIVAGDRAATAFILARALWRSPDAGSRQRATQVAQRAIEEFTAADDGDEAQQVRAWLGDPRNWVPVRRWR